MFLGKSRSMSGTLPMASLRNRPMKRLFSTGSMWDRPMRKQMMEDTEDPRPRPGGRLLLALGADPRTRAPTSRARFMMSR